MPNPPPSPATDDQLPAILTVTALNHTDHTIDADHTAPGEVTEITDHHHRPLVQRTHVMTWTLDAVTNRLCTLRPRPMTSSLLVDSLTLVNLRLLTPYLIAGTATSSQVLTVTEDHLFVATHIARVLTTRRRAEALHRVVPIVT